MSDNTSSNNFRENFPFLTRQPNLTYFDSAATSLLPESVIGAENDYYLFQGGGSPFRGNSSPSQLAISNLHQAKKTITDFFGAKPTEFISVNNTTQAINLVALSWAKHHLHAGDQILLSVTEHHSNIVPWQVLAKELDLEIVWLEINRNNGQLRLDDLATFLQNKKLKFVALTNMSNVLGILNPVDKIAKMIKKTNQNRSQDRQIRFLVDGAQTAGWYMNNFTNSGIDFFAFSGHKMFANPGAGGILVKQELLLSGEFQPAFYGGGMVSEVNFSQTVISEDIEKRFQPGTVNVPAIISLAAAINYIENLYLDNNNINNNSENISQPISDSKNNSDQSLSSREIAKKRLATLAAQTQLSLSQIPHIQFLCPDFHLPLIIPETSTYPNNDQNMTQKVHKYDPKSPFPPIQPPAKNKNPIQPHLFTFTSTTYNTADLANLLDHHGFIVRYGYHCAEPLYHYLGKSEAIRLSFAPYNTTDDIVRLTTLLQNASQYLQKI